LTPMRVDASCITCLERQAMRAARLATKDKQEARALAVAAVSCLKAVEPELSPPEIAAKMYRLLRARLGGRDIFKPFKDSATGWALKRRERLRHAIQAAADPFRLACRLAIAANVIDMGAPHDLAAERFLNEAATAPLAIDHSESFVNGWQKAERILYLADNCGELVVDGLLLETLGKPATVAVRGEPVLNDATRADARASRLPAFVRVIDNGLDCPGTPLRRVADDLAHAFATADLIVSKGQGNFETLSLAQAPIYFLFTVKCEVVARHLAEITGVECRIGQMVLLDGNRRLIS